MDWIKEEEKYIFQTYRRQPFVIVRGKGSYVWDQKGKKYLDFFSGLGVNALGHCHPSVMRAVQNQIKKLNHTSNLYYTVPQIECAKELVKKSFGGKVFFSNSGAEANECAIKLVRRWGNQKGGMQRNEIISFYNSFHGRTMGTLTLTGQEKFQKGFDPLLSAVRYAHFNDLGSVKKLVSEKTCAIFVEPIQGEGGVHPASKAFLQGLRELCDQHNLLSIFDEVQCGMGRSGEIFCFKYYGVQPDILTLAKGLGGGLPIGATIATEKAAALFARGDHASTFGGNPVVCSAALAVLKNLDAKFLKLIQAKGEYILKSLIGLKEKFPHLIKEVRGVGLMVGVELMQEGDPIVEFCRNNGLLINCAQKNVLRFLPPLNISQSEIKSGLSVLGNSFEAMG